MIAEGMIAVPTILDDVREFGVKAFFAAPPLLRVLLIVITSYSIHYTKLYDDLTDIRASW